VCIFFKDLYRLFALTSAIPVIIFENVIKTENIDLLCAVVAFYCDVKLKGQSHEKVGELRVWRGSLGPN
jgi:hypothetical protein